MSKTALIIGSPKMSGSCSACFCETMRDLLGESSTAVYHSHGFMKGSPDFSELLKFDNLVFVFPLYVDGIPSNFLRFLTALEAFLLHQPKEFYIHTIVNCGFYEGEQSQIAFEMIQNWCAHTGNHDCGGVGIGGGPMFAGVQGTPVQNRFTHSIRKALEVQKEAVLNQKRMEVRYPHVDISRFFYLHIAHHGWNAELKKNGYTKRTAFMKM